MGELIWTAVWGFERRDSPKTLIDYVIKSSGWEVVDRCVRPNHAFIAIRDGIRVVCKIVKMRRGRFDAEYRVYDESDLSLPTDCPARILNVLSAPIDLQAENWRSICAEYKPPVQLKVGDVVVFDEPFRFSNEREIRRFIVGSMRFRRRNIKYFTPADNSDGLNYKIKNWRQYSFKIYRTIDEKLEEQERFEEEQRQQASQKIASEKSSVS